MSSASFSYTIHFREIPRVCQLRRKAERHKNTSRLAALGVRSKRPNINYSLLNRKASACIANESLAYEFLFARRARILCAVRTKAQKLAHNYSLFIIKSQIFAFASQGLALLTSFYSLALLAFLSATLPKTVKTRAVFCALHSLPPQLFTHHQLFTIHY